MSQVQFEVKEAFMHTRPLAVWTYLSFCFLRIYCLFLLSPHLIYYETCKLYARAELQPLCPGKHPNSPTRTSCCFLHPGLSQAVWSACLHGVTAHSATMEGPTYVSSRRVSELVAKALSTKVAGVYPYLFLWVLITDVPCTTGIHLLL